MRFTKYWNTVFKTAAGGAAVTLGGTTLACVGALCIESTAHRTLFRFFPHWYRDVEYAFGLEPHLLEAVRSTVPPEKTLKYNAEEAVEWKQNAEWLEKNAYYAGRGEVFSCAMTS